MSGVSSRYGTFALAKQSAKGTPAASPALKFHMSGSPSLGPVKNRARFAMTDAGRDVGAGYTSSMGVQGDVPLYLHPDGFALLAYLALGANADAGSSPNYTHTATPANDVPWFTCWAVAANGTVIERFDDCKLDSLRVEGTAGQPLQASLSIVGLNYTFLASDTGLAVLTSSPYLYPEFLGQFSIDSTAQKLHRFSIGVDNGLSQYQADDYLPSDIDPGGRAVTCSFATRFTGPTAFPDYRTFFYGSTSGTAPSPATGSHVFNAKVVRDANTSVEFQMPQVTWASVPRPQPDPGGAPIEVEVSCEVERPAAGIITTWITKDQTATV